MSLLIVYASKYGSTQKAVNILSDELEKKNIKNTAVNVNVISKNNIDLTKYDAILIGGSIYFGKIQKNIIKFCQNNKKTLLKKKIGLFICSGNEKEIDRQFKNSFDSELLNHSINKGYFGYEYDFEKMNFLYKIIVKKIAGINQSKSEIKIDKIKNFVNKFNKDLKKGIDGQE